MNQQANVTPHGHLIRIAAELVSGAGLPSCFDEGNFYKSTPRAERRRILKALDDINEWQKQLGIQIRRYADELAASNGKGVP